MHDKHPHHGHKPEDKKPADVVAFDEVPTVPVPDESGGGGTTDPDKPKK